MSVNFRYSWLWLILLAAVPYLASIHYPFVYDDHGVIVENEYLDNLSNLAPTLKLKTMTDPDIVDGVRPVVITTYFFDRAWWGLRPFGYRITNLALHSLVTVLVFGFSLHLLGDRRWAFLAALCFAWHPLLIEPVQSPSFREDILYSLFGLVFVWIGMKKPDSVFWLPVSLLVFILALLSKEAAVVFPVLLAVGWWIYPGRRPSPAMVRAWGACLAVIVVAWGWMVFFQRPGIQQVGVAWNGLSFRGSECWWSFPWLFFWNIGKIIIPHPLSIDYRVLPVTGPFELKFMLGLPAMVFFVWLIHQCRRRHPAFAFSLAWMLVAFLPAGNLLPLFNPVADRYVYLMVPGFVLSVMCALRWLSPGWWPVACAAAVVYLGATWHRLPDWKDDRTLWLATLAVEPGSARAHTWLGLAEKKEGRQQQAWEHFTEAEQLNPHDPSPTVNKAVLLGEKGDLAASEEQLRDVLQKYPRHTGARKNLATCLRLQGRDAEAAVYERPPVLER